MPSIAVIMNTRESRPMIGATLHTENVSPVTATPAAVGVLAVAYGIGLLIGYTIR